MIKLSEEGMSKAKAGWKLGLLGQLAKLWMKLKVLLQGDFSDGTVVKNTPANAGGTDLIPGPGRSHMPWSN